LYSANSLKNIGSLAVTQKHETEGRNRHSGESHILQRAPDPLDFGGIEHAVNDAAKRVNAIWLALVFLMTYVLISTGKISHKDLFLETPVKLPIVGVDVPLRGYFVFVPTFILALHFYFSVQLSGLAEKFREYETILFDIEKIESRQDRLRQRLDNSLFAKVLGGPRGRLKILIRVVSWNSMVVAPVWLILFVQLTYLPAQDSLVTNWQRAVLVADVCLALAYVLPWILRRNNLFFKRVASETHLAFSFRILRESGWPDAVITLVAIFGAVWISFLVAIFPWEYSPNFALTKAWFMAGADPVSRGPARWFSNRLVLSDQNLIEGIDVANVKVTRVARNRNFVAAIFDRADLRQVDFTGSNLSYASLIGANLQKANLDCAEIFADTGPYGCVELHDARLDASDLRDASLLGARMYGATLRNAKLDRAVLQLTQLQGATLDGASLNAASLWATGLDGASLRNASLIAASLHHAKMRGADFSGAILFAAVLDSSLAQNASFAGAQLQAALMSEAHFDDTNFLAAAVYGTNISNSSFHGARISNVLTAPRWSNGYDYYNEFLTSTVEGDPFGKNGDDRALSDNLGYYGSGSHDPESSEYFADYASISQTEIDGLVRRLTDSAPSNSLDEVKRRLSRLGPDTATSDWSNLVEKSTSGADYVRGLGERLIVIACAKAGGASVIRGLINNQMLCPYADNINQVLRIGRRPDGAICENMPGLQATLDHWSTCPKAKSDN
jgi:uncharacterized protein YjbI with pentapeptide repeats